jgi:hypothetical protein
MNNCTSIPIISVNGETEGTIVIDVVPTDENGEEFEEIPENPMELVGENLQFYVHIKEIKDLPDNFCKGVQVEYTSFNDNQNYKTKIYNEDGKENSFNIDEKFEHKINYLSEEDIDFFTKDKICFKIYAYETVEIKEKLGVPNKEEIIKNNINVHFLEEVNKDNNKDNNEDSNKDSNNKNNTDKKSKHVPLAKTRYNTAKTFRNTVYKSSKNIPHLKDKDKDCMIF